MLVLWDRSARCRPPIPFSIRDRSLEDPNRPGHRSWKTDRPWANRLKIHSQGTDRPWADRLKAHWRGGPLGQRLRPRRTDFPWTDRPAAESQNLLRSEALRFYLPIRSSLSWSTIIQLNRAMTTCRTNLLSPFGQKKGHRGQRAS